MIQEHYVKVYAFLIESKRREIKSIPEEYKIPVAEYLVQQLEKPKST